MQLKISLEIKLTREPPPPPPPEPQPDGSFAIVETAQPHYPLGFTPNQVEAKRKTP